MKGLSKSRYTAYCQCPKMLWLRTYKPELIPEDPALQAKFEKGNEVGELAKTLFGPFVDVTTYKDDGSLDLGSMLEKTKEEMAKGTETICEASFSHDLNYCAVDILRKKGDGWAIYEVKSSTYRDEEKDTPERLLKYAWDIAYQKWLLEQCRVKVTGIYLIRLNSNYVRHGDLDVNELFHIKDMKELVDNEFLKVAPIVKKAKEILEGDEPEMDIYKQCKNPYECGFFDYCVGGLPVPSVFDLYRMGFEKKCELFHQGKLSFDDLRDEKLNEIQRMQVESFLNGIDFIDSESIKGYLEQLTYPLYFLDFETMQPVLPEFDGTSPYQQIPFQYSLHWIEKPGGKLHHSEFLGDSVTDPRRDLAEQLCCDIPEDVCVTAYNKAFECGRLSELANAFPDLADHLLNIREHIFDLIEPFRQKMVYRPAMNGSFSIKKVLPALFPDDPKLNYDNLQGTVHNGGDAMTIYPEIAKMTPDDAAAARDSLLKYCHLDTLAMVRIWQKLHEYAK